MGRETQKLTKKILTIGQAVVEINDEFEKNNELLKIVVLSQILGLKIQDTPELYFRDGRFFLDKIELLHINMDKGRIHIPKDNEIWLKIKEHKSFEELINEISRIKDAPLPSFIRHVEILTREFVHDIILNLLYQREKKSISWLKKKIQKLAKILVDDLLLEEATCDFIAPLKKIEIDTERIEIGKYAIIRRARYSEKLDYLVGFDSRTGRPDFQYILELQSKSIAPGRDKEKENFRLLAAVILALRLVFGGGIGTELAHFWMTLPPLPESKIGQSHPVGESVIEPSRFLQPGIYSTRINTNRIRQVVEIIKILHPIVLAPPSKTMLALKRYGQAAEATDPTDSIIDSIISLECIFGGYSRTTTIMAALMLSENSEPNSDVQQLLTDCYEARNKIVHGSSIETTEKAARGNLPEKSEQLVEIVRKCILESLKFSDSEWKKMKQIANEYCEKDRPVQRIVEEDV